MRTRYRVKKNRSTIIRLKKWDRGLPKDYYVDILTTYNREIHRFQYFDGVKFHSEEMKTSPQMNRALISAHRRGMKAGILSGRRLGMKDTQKMFFAVVNSLKKKYLWPLQQILLADMMELLRLKFARPDYRELSYSDESK